MDQGIFEPQDAFASPQTSFKLLGITWFGEIVVGAGFEACDEILFRAF
jgi:hypothetical protein